MAPDPGRTGPVVEGGADLQPVVTPGRLGAAAGGGAAAWRDGGRDGVPRRHRHPGAPQGRGRGQKGGSSAQRDAREGLGRSRGGYGTKACVLADASGRAIGFALAPGQAHELPLAPLLLAVRSEEHTSELQSRQYLVCRLLLEKKKQKSSSSLPHTYNSPLDARD